MRAPLSLLEKKLNLKAMKLLVVDGNEFSRSFTRNLCRSFNFREILAAGNTADAFGHLQSNEFDLMLLDWMLKPESADVFVRQLRTDPGIRSPFVPIIVLSSIVDSEIVGEVRDAGANEFLGRPFDLDQLLLRLAQELLTPRPFIRCPSYVGPERRRKQREFEGPERRSDVIALMRPTSTAAAATKAAGPGGQTIAVMAEAGEKVIVAEEVRYRQVRRQDLDELNQLAERLHQASLPDGAAVEKIYLKSNALKAMGQTFGFPLLTEAGNSLCALLRKLPREQMLTALTVQAVGVHIRTMSLIVAQDIRHDGGAVGADLIKGLKALVDRVAVEAPSLN
jgi:two-component system chemotaxis response regulator CheY